MIKKFIAMLFSLIISDVSYAKGFVLNVDEEHMQIGNTDNSKLEYIIPPTQEVTLDFTNYEFTLWPKSEPSPDTVSIIINENQQYFLSLKPTQRVCSISSKNLKSRAGSLQFTGFKSGDKVIIAIGKFRLDEIKKEDVLRVHWVGLVAVK